MTVEHPEHDNVGSSFSAPISGSGPAGLISTSAVNTLPYESHAQHPACLITPSFRSSADIASIAIVVVNAEGYFVYANATAADLFGFPTAELCGKHIFEVTVAESSLIAEEFGWLQVNHRWSGHVLLRRPSGDSVRVGVNAFSSHLSDNEPEFMALLHATSLDGPAVERLTEQPASTQMTTRDVRLLHLIAEGFADKEIASLLSTSVWTINRDVSEMLGRLNVMSRTEACVTAIRTGLIA